MTKTQATTEIRALAGQLASAPTKNKLAAFDELVSVAYANDMLDRDEFFRMQELIAATVRGLGVGA